MKNIIISLLILMASSSFAYADYSKNPNCRGFGILEVKERQKCLEANPKKTNNSSSNGKLLNESGQIDTSGIKNKTKKMMKSLGKMGININTDSKLFKTGKYSENK